jgi:heme/copper-type cytochrome/quinol oxidase subunit 2
MYSGILTLPQTTGTFDNLLNWYLLFGIGASIIVISMLVFFMVRYRSKGHQGPMPEHKVEGWKIVLVTVLISVSVLSFAEYQTFSSFSNIEIPTNATCMANTNHPCVQVCVQAYQWGWNYTYPKAGQTCSQSYYSGLYWKGNGSNLNRGGNLTVPEGWDVVLNISSKDVFHSMGINMLAEKEDAVPGRVNQMWFMIPSLNVSPSPDIPKVTCNSAGTSCTYWDAVRCFELCGIGHAEMWANLTVVSQATWLSWTGGATG